MPCPLFRHVVRLTRPYRQVLRLPGAAAFFVAAAPGRVGVAMTGLGIIWLVHWSTGSFGNAGVVTGAFALATASVGPQVARLIDRYGQPRILPPCVLAHGAAVAAMVVAAANRSPSLLIAGAAVLVGATIPQYGALTAVRWSALLRGTSALPTAFSLESQSNGIAFLVGPALVGTVSALAHPIVGSSLAAVLVVVAGLSLASQRESAPGRQRPEARGRTRSLLRPGFAVLVGINAGLGVFFGSMQVSVTAFAVERGQAHVAGPLYSVMSCTSLLAGLVYGSRRWRTNGTTQLALALAALTAGSATVLAAGNTTLLALALAATGLALAPTLILLTVITEAIVEPDVLTQAFTWQGSASAAGAALAAAGAGYAIDILNTGWGFGLAVAATALAAVGTWLARQALSRSG